MKTYSKSFQARTERIISKLLTDKLAQRKNKHNSDMLTVNKDVTLRKYQACTNLNMFNETCLIEICSTVVLLFPWHTQSQMDHRGLVIIPSFQVVPAHQAFMIHINNFGLHSEIQFI